jgi:RimJ/RimL family protein N-acetyltransferase
MYRIRAFLPSDLIVYRDMRLEALQTEAGNFGNSYSQEAGLSEAEWLDRITNPYRCCFGLYKDEELIGITGIVRSKDKPEEAYMSQSYIRKAYRGQGLAALLYQARIEWAKANDVRYLVIGHRQNNIASRNANQKFHFVYTHQEAREWPDGCLEPMFYYRLQL